MGADHPQVRGWLGELETILSLVAYNDIEGMPVHHRRGNELLGISGREQLRAYLSDREL